MLRHKLFVILFHCLAFVAVIAPVAVPANDQVVLPGDARLQQALANLARGHGDLKLLSITYDDRHPLHGGLTLKIQGNGKVTQTASREKVGQEKEVSEDELKALIDLLLKHRAWEQQEAGGPAVPGESRARLVIAYADDSVTVWEKHVNLGKKSPAGNPRGHEEGRVEN